MPKSLIIVSLFPPAETDPVSVAEPAFVSMRFVVETMSPLTVLPSSTWTFVRLTRMLPTSPTTSPLVTFVAEMSPTALFTLAELTKLNETLPFAFSIVTKTAFEMFADVSTVLTLIYPESWPDVPISSEPTDAVMFRPATESNFILPETVPIVDSVKRWLPSILPLTTTLYPLSSIMPTSAMMSPFIVALPSNVR